MVSAENLGARPHHRPYLESSLLVAVLVTYSALALFRLGSFDLDADEGRFGVAATNMLLDHRQLAMVSEQPLGVPGTKPYLYPLTVALSIWVFGRNEAAIRGVNVVGLGIAAFLLAGVVEIVVRDRAVTLLTFAFFLLNAGTIAYARSGVSDPLVVVWGCVGLFAAAKFLEGGRLPWALLCGAALGFSFLAKLWLFLPFLLACLAMFVLKFPPQPQGKFLAGVILALLVLLVVSASHLLLVLWLTPEHFARWMDIYYVFSFSSRVKGTGHDPALWFRPWWFYLAAFFKATFFGLPLVFLGVTELVRRRTPALGAVLLALLSPIVVLSFFRVKQASYIFPAFPALALLLALGSLYFYRHAQPREIAFSSLASLTLAAAFLAISVVDLREFAAISMLYLAYLGCSFSGARRRKCAAAALALASGSAMLFGGVVIVRRSLQHRTYFREIAAYLAPTLRPGSVQEVVFISPEFPAMEFYTFRSGEYWRTFYSDKRASASVSDLRSGAHAFYIVDPSGTLYGSGISPEELKALYKHAVDVTPEIEKSIGHRLWLRVYVPGGKVAHGGEGT